MERHYEEKIDDVLLQNYDLMEVSFEKNAH